MTPNDIARIECELGVVLPDDLREFLTSKRDNFDPDDCSVIDDSDGIIEMTKEYRSGFAGLPPWPASWVYLGDESDACPYYIDCTNGIFTQLHKGDLRQKPLKTFESFTGFRLKRRSDTEADIAAAKLPLSWKDTVLFYLPSAIALFVIFVIVPTCAFGISMLFKWLFR